MYLRCGKDLASLSILSVVHLGTSSSNLWWQHRGVLVWEEDPEVRPKPAPAKASEVDHAPVRVEAYCLVYWPPQDNPTRWVSCTTSLKAAQALNFIPGEENLWCCPSEGTRGVNCGASLEVQSTARRTSVGSPRLSTWRRVVIGKQCDLV